MVADGADQRLTEEEFDPTAGMLTTVNFGLTGISVDATDKKSLKSGRGLISNQA